MTQAVLAFSSDNILTRRLDGARASRLKLHWLLQISAGACILVSFICIYTYKVTSNREHFSTTHSYWGFLTLLFCLGAAGGGTLAAYSINLRHIIKPIIIKIVHATFGLVGYSMAIFTIFLGLNHPWTHERLAAGWINTLIACVALIWLYAVSRPVITVCGRVAGLTRSNWTFSNVYRFDCETKLNK